MFSAHKPSLWNCVRSFLTTQKEAIVTIGTCESNTVYSSVRLQYETRNLPVLWRCSHSEGRFPVSLLVGFLSSKAIRPQVPRT